MCNAYELDVHRFTPQNNQKPYGFGAKRSQYSYMGCKWPLRRGRVAEQSLLL